MSPSDREYDALRSAIRELRSFDERTAPAFEAILGRRRAGRGFAWSPGRLAIVAGVAIVAAGAVFRASRPDPITVPREVLALSVWRPMTDVLLETPNRALLSETPRLSASLIQIHHMGDSR